MRILFVVHQFMPEFSAGTEIVTLNLAKAAQRSGHQVTILTSAVLGPELWSGITPEGLRQHSVDGLKILAVPRELVPDIYGFSKDGEAGACAMVDAFLDANPFDVVHVMHAMRMVYVVESVQRRGIPFILTTTDFFLSCYRINHIHPMIEGEDGTMRRGRCVDHAEQDNVEAARVLFRQDRMDAIVDGAAAIVACSPFVGNAMRDEFPGRSVRIVSHGIDLLRYRHRPARKAQDEIVFGYLGTISRAKGLAVLVEGFVRAAPSNARLAIHGPQDGDDQFAAEVRQLAARNDRIAVHGPVRRSDVPTVLQGFDVLCLPSQVPETFSLSLHEGFASGLPAIVSALGNPKIVVETDGCGAVVGAEDVEGWADVIRDVSADPSAIDRWRQHLPLPNRLEEEAFLYDCLYRTGGR